MPHPDSYPGGTSGGTRWTQNQETDRDKTWVFPRDTPKWMVKIMENLMSKWDDLGGNFPTIFGNIHVVMSLSFDKNPLDQYMGGSSVV